MGILVEGSEAATQCLDTNNGATDDYGSTCSSYNLWADTGYCGVADDGDFSASTMCCACGGGHEAVTFVECANECASTDACIAFDISGCSSSSDAMCGGSCHLYLRKNEQELSTGSCIDSALDGNTFCYALERRTSETLPVDGMGPNSGFISSGPA